MRSKNKRVTKEDKLGMREKIILPKLDTSSCNYLSISCHFFLSYTIRRCQMDMRRSLKRTGGEKEKKCKIET